VTDEYHIEVYETETGKLPYMDWERSLSADVRAIVSTRLIRIRRGNMGGGGVAYMAHIGGFIAGLLIAFIFKAFDRKPS